MIGYLKGTIEVIDTPYIIIDVNGVGYKVLVSVSALQEIGSIGKAAKLFIHTHVREDALELYGFLSLEELKLFEILISVSGVGPKTAVGIFSLGSAGSIMGAILSGNVEFFTGVPRLGKKNAQKIIIELKSKLGSKDLLDLSEGASGDNAQVLGALKNFGFSGQEVQSVMQIIAKKGDLTTEEKIRIALQHLGK